VEPSALDAPRSLVATDPVVPDAGFSAVAGFPHLEEVLLPADDEPLPLALAAPRESVL